MLFVAQTLSANKIGFAKRVKQLCQDGGDIDGVAGVAISEHIVNKDGIDETVVIDALALTVGKTAALECDTIEETISKLSTNLDKWRAEVDYDDGRSDVIAPFAVKQRRLSPAEAWWYHVGCLPAGLVP